MCDNEKRHCILMEIVMKISIKWALRRSDFRLEWAKKEENRKQRPKQQQQQQKHDENKITNEILEPIQIITAAPAKPSSSLENMTF